MENEFHRIILDALTEAIIKKTVVTIKNNDNNCIIVITATEGEIVVSLSKIPSMMNDIIMAISDCLGRSPDMVYNRMSTLKEDYLIYYMVWLDRDADGKAFVEKEFAMPQNHITYLSSKAIALLQGNN